MSERVSALIVSSPPQRVSISFSPWQDFALASHPRQAIRGYKEINLKAMRILPRGGYLATCSCSHFMTDDRFRTMLADAAKDAQVQLRQIEARQQGPDHPILWNVPETDYLKFYIFQIV